MVNQYGESILAYLVDQSGFGSGVIFTNYQGSEEPVGQEITVESNRIVPVVGTDGKTRMWLK